MPLIGRALAAKRSVLIKLICLVLLVAAANLAADWIVEALEFEVRPGNEDMVHRVIMLSAAAYTVLIAIPFVPGVEIGLALIATLGPAIVFLVYISTFVGLSAAFLVGRLVPTRGLIRFLDDLGLARTSRLLATLGPMAMEERLAFLASNAPNRVVPFLLRHRYIALFIVINLPGNIVIGGGGGIAMMAGASQLYSLPAYLVTIALAVAPVPIAILMFGKVLL